MNLSNNNCIKFFLIVTFEIDFGQERGTMNVNDKIKLQ